MTSVTGGLFRIVACGGWICVVSRYFCCFTTGCLSNGWFVICVMIGGLFTFLELCVYVVWCDLLGG